MTIRYTSSQQYVIGILGAAGLITMVFLLSLFSSSSIAPSLVLAEKFLCTRE